MSVAHKNATRQTVEQIRQRLNKKSAALQEFLNSELGKAVIDVLEDEFYHGDIFNTDPHVTAYNCGRRDVVVYLKQLSRWKSNDGTT